MTGGVADIIWDEQSAFGKWEEKVFIRGVTKGCSHVS